MLRAVSFCGPDTSISQYQWTDAERERLCIVQPRRNTVGFHSAGATATALPRQTRYGRLGPPKTKRASEESRKSNLEVCLLNCYLKSAVAETTDNRRILRPFSSALSIPARLKRERITRPFGGQTSASGGLLDKLKKRPL